MVVRGAQDRLDDADVGEALEAGRLGLAALEYAAREHDKLGGELIAGGELHLADLALAGDAVAKWFVVAVDRLTVQVALGPDHAVPAGRGGAEADGQLGDATAGEPEDRGGRLVDALEAGVAAARDDRGDLDRLLAEQVAHGVDRIYAHVIDGAARERAAGADVAGSDLLREYGGEDPRVADLAGT